MEEGPIKEGDGNPIIATWKFLKMFFQKQAINWLISFINIVYYTYVRRNMLHNTNLKCQIDVVLVVGQICGDDILMLGDWFPVRKFASNMTKNSVGTV